MNTPVWYRAIICPRCPNRLGYESECGSAFRPEGGTNYVCVRFTITCSACGYAYKWAPKKPGLKRPTSS